MTPRRSVLSGAIFAALFATTTIYAEDPETTVKFDPKGTANYTILDIQRFDWQSSGDLVIVNALPKPSIANGVEVGTFQAWAATAVPGDTVQFLVHAHARLNDFLSSAGGGIPVSTLSRNGSSCLAGSGGACFEVTAAVSGLETATLVAPGQLDFTALHGDYKFFVHFKPNSKVNDTNAPSGGTFSNFTDGTVFLAGDVTHVDGSFLFGTGGNNEMQTNVSFFDPKFIVASTGALTEITAATFDTLTRPRRSSLEAIVPVGDPIGLTVDVDAEPAPPAYLVLTSDLRLKGDANTSFRGQEVPREGLCRVTFGPIDENEYILLRELQQGDLYPAKPNPFAEPLDDYSAGGQVGAPSVGNPTSFGEFTHTNDPGTKKDPQPSAHFVFRSGTHSAPDDTIVQHVVCTQPVACEAARANGKFKQIQWDGIGSFRTLGAGVPSSWGASEDHAGGGSRHYYRVRMVDLGEPGKGKPGDVCPSGYTPGDAIEATATAAPCGCPDAYQLEIHKDAATDSPIIYTVGGFINGGNIQIHDLTGNPGNP